MVECFPKIKLYLCNSLQYLEKLNGDINIQNLDVVEEEFEMNKEFKGELMISNEITQKLGLKTGFKDFAIYKNQCQPFEFLFPLAVAIDDFSQVSSYAQAFKMHTNILKPLRGEKNIIGDLGMKTMQICYDDNLKIPLKYSGGFLGYCDSDKELETQIINQKQ